MDRLAQIESVVASNGNTIPLTKDEANWLTAEVRRLRWLIEWVDEHASFTRDEWPTWEKLQEHPEPWLLEDE